MHPRLIVLILLGIVGCSPVQGYSGPALPAEQVATVKRDFEEDEIDLPRMAADGIEFGYSGIQLLPGKHDFVADVVAKEPPYDCRPYTQFNGYGYEQCLDDKYKDDRHDHGSYYSFPLCDCFDYLETHRSCEQDVHDGRCEVTATLEAGRRYDIMVTRSDRAALFELRADGRPTPVTERTCRVIGSRTTRFEENLGTGRATANYNGIYSCD